MPSLRERLHTAAHLAQLKDAYLTCGLRGQRQGERACKGCGGTKLKALYACPHHPQGVVVDEECRACRHATSGGDGELKRRREICAACPEHKLDGGRLRCSICQCDEPYSTRPYCPVKKWGVEAWQAQKERYEATLDKPLPSQDTILDAIVARGPTLYVPAQPRPPILLSVIIPARNERELILPEIRDPAGKVLQAGGTLYHPNALQMTLDSIAETSQGQQATEVIVVDDGSDTPLAFEPPPGLPVRLIRNPVPCGSPASINIGLAYARGEAAVAIDAHMLVADQDRRPLLGGLQRLAREALTRQALVVGRCGTLQNMTMWNPAITYCSAAFDRFDPAALEYTPKGFPFALHWTHFTPVTETRPVKGVMGASLCASMDLWRRLGGLLDECRPWGWNEETLTLKCAFLGVPMFLVGQVCLLHWFRTGKAVFPHNNYDKYLNAVRVAKVLFDDTTFRDFWLPIFRRYPMWQAAYDQELQQPALIGAMQQWRAAKVRTDAEVMRDLFGVTL